MNNTQTENLGFEPYPRMINHLHDGLERLEQLNQIEGFRRWKLECHDDGTFQVLEYRESGGVRWKSFRKTSLRIVIGWATQQTVMRLRSRPSAQPQQLALVAG